MAKLKRALITIGALLAVSIATGTAEVVYAIKSPRLPSRAPYDLNENKSGTKKILWLGDSTAAGVGASTANKSLPQQVQKRAFPNDSLEVLAISGATIEDVVAEQLPQVHEYNATDIFISIGANDVTHLTEQADFEMEYKTLLDQLPKVNIVLLGVPDMGAPTRFLPPLKQIASARGAKLDTFVKRQTGVIYVNIHAETGPKTRSDPKRYLAADGFHPSDDGYQLWADAVLAAIGTSEAATR